METETTKCSHCNEEVDVDETMIDRKGECCCMGCYENGMQYASTLTVFNPDESIENVLFDEYFVYDNDEGLVDEIIKEQKYVQTDGWRGYTDWVFQPGFKVIGEGWVTGYPDESVQHKLFSNTFFEDLKSGEVIPPCRIIWLFGHTSNVFSTASEMLIDKDNEEVFKKWLKKLYGKTPDDVNQSFS